MNIVKTNGKLQSFNPQKIWKRIKDQCSDLKGVQPDKLFQKIVPAIYDGITSTQVDEILAYKTADLTADHPDYATLGGRLLMTRQAKIINKRITELGGEEVTLEPIDLSYDFFAAITFLKKYSTKDNTSLANELPSMMYRRVASTLANNIEDYNDFYEELTNKRISAATPILTNSGTDRKSFISCNLSFLIDDSTEGILKTLDNISGASREGAGIGLCIDSLRSKESNVSSFNGKAGGVTRFADMVQSHMRFFKQGTRAGSCALYLSLWHKDIIDFLELRLPVGDEKLRARDLFTAVIINDNFMKALINGDDWYLFCPKDIKNSGLKPLYELHGEEYENEYNKAVEAGIGTKVNPKTIWDAIITSQVETGTPYVFYKDAANRLNFQDNIGTIRQSQLCIEIVQFTDPKNTAQCTLGAINLAEHDNSDTIAKSTKILVRLLNNVIDKTLYPDKQSERAGKAQRAIAIGVAGLADYFAKKKIPFHSQEALEESEVLSRVIYEAARQESTRLAEIDGSYPEWKGSRYEKGETLNGTHPNPIPMRNSLLIGLMPTASTSILLGVNEAFEPFHSNMFVRNTGSGEFIIANKYLVSDLEKEGLWNESIKKKIILNEGSVQEIAEIPQWIKDLYKTVWEIPMRHILDMAAIRQKYVDQSQSMNLYYKSPEYSKISGALRYAWELGLKTGVYYTRVENQLAKPKRLFSSEELPPKPENSPYECFGCSS